MNSWEDILDNAGIDSNGNVDEHKEDIEDGDHGTTRRLILWNDEFNTFEYVINVLMEICQIPAESASEMAKMVHLIGHVYVMESDENEIKLLHNTFSELGLVTTIE